MRKLLLTSALLTMTILASAQAEQGNVLLSGSSNFGFISTSPNGGGDNLTNFVLDTRAGYFVIDNLSAGLLVSFVNSSQGDNKQTFTTFGPWARYYVGGQFFLGAAYGFSNSKFESGGSSFEGDSNTLSFEAGYPIFLGESAALEPTLNYSTDSSDGNTISSSFGVLIGFTLYL